MRFISSLRTGVMIAGISASVLGLRAQEANAPVKFEGIPPRSSPADYQFHAQAGKLTVAAEFTGHSVGTPDGTLTTADYVVIETAIYGPPGTRIKLSPEDFSLRINGKKPLPGQPYGLVVKTLKDPELEPPASETKSKNTSFGSGGQADSSSPPPPFRVPDQVRHAWGLRLQKASLAEGERALPQAGLIYFEYRGKTEKIESIELSYTGAGGKATLALQP